MVILMDFSNHFILTPILAWYYFTFCNDLFRDTVQGQVARMFYYTATTKSMEINIKASPFVKTQKNSEVRVISIFSAQVLTVKGD